MRKTDGKTDGMLFGLAVSWLFVLVLVLWWEGVL